MLDEGRNITDGETLLSAGGTFTLGFFSPGVSTKRYLGIWFSVSSDAVCWVANRDCPLIDTSGVLVVSDTGGLYLLDGSGQIAWSSNSSRANSAVAQLLESGNLVLRDRNRSAILWQSFDYPSNTLLPGMKMGKNLWTGAEWYLSSWRSANDPSTGTYRYVTETEAIPENVLWDGNVEKYRTGPWNGILFSGIPEAATYTNLFSFLVTISTGEITYGYTSKPGAPLSRLVVMDTGVVKRLVWDASNRAWQTFLQGPRDVCDAYAKCGPFGLCNANDAASTSFCSCLKGFGPASPSAWYMRETSNGCRRNVALDCGNGTTKDGFVLVQGVKLPDTHSASVDMSITVEECRVRCFANCSCMAYAAADIRKGGGGIGCIIWTNNITDVRYVDRGQDLYLRLAESELDGIPRNPATTVPSVDLPAVRKATGIFSESHVIGQGGFGIVYKGQLPDGRMIAVKRFKQSALTKKGKSDFTREVEVMARLRHGNLVRLLAYCNQGSERILIYDFMPNKSLDLYIFGEPSLRAMLNWRQRLDIIHGVAHGVAYLHEGSGESVVHRDLKPPNVLLDENFRPKIADFGTAKLFVADRIESNLTIVFSPGYASPEYAMPGDMTPKCDVYSFGVVLLETLSGQRNGAMQRLLSHAWGLWEQDRTMALLDSTMNLPPLSGPDSEIGSELERCIQIGLLCVQESPDDRPAMSAVVAMLSSKSSQINRPNRPGIHSRTRPPLRETNLQRPDTIDLA